MSKKRIAEGKIIVSGAARSRKDDADDAAKWRRFDAAIKEFAAAARALDLTVTIGPTIEVSAKTTAKPAAGAQKRATSRRK